MSETQTETQMTEPTKRCARCGETKPLSQFYKYAKSRDGHGSWCKPCDARRERGQSRSSRMARTGNVNRCTALSAFVKRGVLKRPEDKVLLLHAEQLVADLIAEQGGADHATIAQRELARQVGLGSVVQAMATRELAEQGPFITDSYGVRKANPAFEVLAKYMSASTRALSLLGTDRKAAPALTLEDYVARRAELPADSPVPAEAVVVTEEQS